MDDDLDDPLDDLLRDTSANKFNKPTSIIVGEDSILPGNGNKSDAAISSSTSRKEKKSALLAELFGPTSLTTPSLDDLSGGNMKNSESLKSLTSLPAEELVTGGQAKNHLPISSQQPMGSIFGNFPIPQITESNMKTDTQPTFKLEEKLPTILSPPADPSLKKTDEFNFGGYVPSSAAGLPKSRPATTGTPRQQAGSVFGNQNLLSSPQVTDSPPVIKKEERPSVPFLPDATVRPVTSPPALVIPSVDQQSLITGVKSVLEDFTKSFGARLEQALVTAAGNSNKPQDGLADIAASLSELQKCVVNAASQALVSDRNGNSAELERRLSSLESRVDRLVQDNASGLRTESAYKAEAAWAKEAVSKLEAQLAAIKLTNSQEIRSLQEQFNGWQETHRTLIDKQKQSEQEVLHLLKAEFKWLERQKEKLKRDRKEHRLITNEIQGKLRLMDTLSAELSLTARDVQSQHLVVENKLQKMEQKWAELLEKQLELRMNESDLLAGKQQVQVSLQKPPMEDLGLALWKLHVQGDEQRLAEQNRFLQVLNTSATHH